MKSGILKAAAACLFCACTAMLFCACRAQQKQTGTQEASSVTGMLPSETAGSESGTQSAFPFARIACVGDSLTYGYLWHRESYPVYLQALTGDAVTVGNFGVNGATVTHSRHVFSLCYTDQHAYQQSMDFAPDCILLMLGTNDAKVWEEASELYTGMLRSLVTSYQEAYPDAVLVLLTAPPTLENNRFAISDALLREEIVPLQRALAEELSLPLFDVRAEMEACADGGRSFIRDAHDDGVHLSEKGASFLASRLYAFLSELSS